MSEIYVAIRNQQRVSMSSINGTAIIVLLVRNGQVIKQQAADLSAAVTVFQGLRAGTYTVLARHADLVQLVIDRGRKSNSGN